MKKSIATIAATLMLGSLVVGCTGAKEKPADGTADNTPAADKKPITFSWLVYDRTEGKVRPDWEIFQEIEKKTGVKVDFQVVSSEGLAEKRQIMIATNTVTDFIQVSTQDGRDYGPEKVFLNLKDYLDKAPNLKKFYDKYPEAKAQATGADGGLYTVPVLEGDAEGKGFNFVWLVRKDLVDKVNLKEPTNPDELYQYLKTLKEKYPDAYPYSPAAVTGDVGLYTVMGNMFTGISGFFNLNPQTGKYAFAPNEKGFKDAIVYMNKLYSEKLLDPEYPFLTAPQWEERIMKGKALVSFYWKANLATLTESAKKAGAPADYELDAITPVVAPGVKNYLYSRAVVGSTGRAVSAKVKDKDRAVQFLDYLLSEEGTNYLALGIQGKSYTLDNGKPVFMKEFGDTPYVPLRRDFGVWYDMINLNNAMSREAWERSSSDKMKAINTKYEKYIIPAPKASVKTKEELELEKSKLSNLTKFLEQKMTEFVTGKTPINDTTYNDFIAQAKKLGSDDLLNMYNTAYARTYGSN